MLLFLVLYRPLILPTTLWVLPRESLLSIRILGTRVNVPPRAMIFYLFPLRLSGAMDDRATYFLNKVASRLATREGQDLSLVKSYVFGRVSTVLHRCVARSVLKRRRDSEDVFKSFDSREFLNKFTVPPSSSQARSAPSSIPPTPPVSNSGTYTSTATKKLF